MPRQTCRRPRRHDRHGSYGRFPCRPPPSDAGRRRSLPPTSQPRRSRSPSCAPTAPPCTGSSRAPLRAGASCSCAGTRERGAITRPTASASGAVSTSTAGERCAWCQVQARVPSPTSTSPTSACGCRRTPSGRASPPRPLSPLPPSDELHRHGGLAATPDGSWVLAVREQHRVDGERRPRHTVVALSTSSTEPGACILVEGHDFFGTARVDPAGERLAVVAWDHPDMPWDSSLLLVVPLVVTRDRDGRPVLVPSGPPTTVAGCPGESVGQPAWQRNGALRSVSDRARLVATVRAGRPARVRGPTRPHRCRRRVPCARLGPRPVDHGRARRRHRGGPHERSGAGTRSWPCSPTGCRPRPRCSPLPGCSSSPA